MFHNTLVCIQLFKLKNNFKKCGVSVKINSTQKVFNTSAAIYCFTFVRILLYRCILFRIIDVLTVTFYYAFSTNFDAKSIFLFSLQML